MAVKTQTTVGKMLDGTCATHKMEGVYSKPVQPEGVWCILLAKRKLLKLVCTNEGCTNELHVSEPDPEGEKRYLSRLAV